MRKVVQSAMRLTTTVWVVLLLCVPPVSESKDRFPDIVAKSVVSLGLQDSQSKWTSIGTGFLMANDQGSSTVLVTCRHIVEPESKPGVKKRLPEIWAKTDPSPIVEELYGMSEESGWVLFRITLIKSDSTLWTGHPNDSVDIAVFDFPPNDSKHDQLGRVSDIHYIPDSFCGEFDSLCLAQDVLFVGFPLGLGDVGNPQPLVRSGIVSYLDKRKKTFMLDAQVFGGSSGSPVVSTGSSRGDRPTMKTRRLLGIVKGYWPSPIRLGTLQRDVSETAKDTIRVPVENAGLGIVFSADLILETIQIHNKRFQAIGDGSPLNSGNK